MNEAEQREADRKWLEQEAAERDRDAEFWASLGADASVEDSSGQARRLRRIIGYMEERERADEALWPAEYELRKAVVHYARQGWPDKERDASAALDGLRGLMKVSES